MTADHGQHFIQHVSDLDVAESKGSAFHTKDQMLHLEGEDLPIDDGFGLTAALHHQVAGAVAVEFRDGFEEVEEIRAVGVVEGGDEAGVDEDELGAVAFGVDLLELGFPFLRVVTVRAELLEDFFGDVDGVAG